MIMIDPVSDVFFVTAGWIVDLMFSLSLVIVLLVDFISIIFVIS